MAKRFTDTAIWQDEWFMELPPEYKLAFMFIKDNCDQAGVWKPNKKLAETMIGFPINWDDFFNTCDGRVKLIQGGYWWISKFVEFQYGTLTEKCKPHIPVINLLKKYGLYERVLIPYGMPISNLEEKEKEKDKEKDKEIIKAKIEIEPPFDDFWNLYDKKVGDKEKVKKKWEKLLQEEREKIMEYIPKYIKAQPDKTYRKNPETFFNNCSWNDELIFKESKPIQNGSKLSGYETRTAEQNKKLFEQ